MRTSHLSRQERARRRNNLLLAWGAALSLVAVAIGLMRLAPDPKDRPLVTVYMRPDCDDCRRWMKHLERNGFRTRTGSSDEWPAVRERSKAVAGMRAAHNAVVGGLVIEGHVPARDIHRALRANQSRSIRALIVPGLPAGAPGVNSGFTRTYVVFAMDDNGLLRPWRTHNHFNH